MYETSNLCALSYSRKMLDTETNKEEKLKEVYHQLEQLQNERKELQDEKTRLTEALALKEEDFVQLQLKVQFVVCASILGLKIMLKKWNLIIFTEPVRSTREGYVLTRVCPSIILSVHPWGGGYPSQVHVGRVPHPTLGTPPIRPGQGVSLLGVPQQGELPLPGGYPTSGTPLLDLARVYPQATPAGGYPSSGTPIRPCWGYPCQRGYPTLGTPLLDLAGEYPPPPGVPHLRYPPVRLGWGIPLPGGYPTSGNR